MARKKELMELENPSMEGNIPVDAAGTEAGVFPGEEAGTPSETDGDGMDLNELLGSMDQEPSENPELPGGELPELTEEEMFGEVQEDSDGSGTVHGADGERDASGEAQPEPATSSETGSAAAKTKRTTRRKKEEPHAEADVEAQKAETEMPESMEATPDNAPNSQTAAADKGGPADDTADGAKETIPQEEMEPAESGLEDTPLPSAEDTAGTAAPPVASSSRRTAARGRKENAPVLTLAVRGEVETEEAPQRDWKQRNPVRMPSGMRSTTPTVPGVSLPGSLAGLSRRTMARPSPS